MPDSRSGNGDEAVPVRPDVTQLLIAWQGGETGAFDELIPLVYSELRRLARSALTGEAEGHTLQTTALVHEAYVRLVGAEASISLAGRTRSV